MECGARFGGAKELLQRGGTGLEFASCPLWVDFVAKGVDGFREE
jgi:hypothetical protein